MIGCDNEEVVPVISYDNYNVLCSVLLSGFTSSAWGSLVNQKESGTAHSVSQREQNTSHQNENFSSYTLTHSLAHPHGNQVHISQSIIKFNNN